LAQLPEAESLFDPVVRWLSAAVLSVGYGDGRRRSHVVLRNADAFSIDVKRRVNAQHRTGA
jgi:hypothetical protein